MFVVPEYRTTSHYSVEARFRMEHLVAGRPDSWAVVSTVTGAIVEHDGRMLMGLSERDAGAAMNWMEIKPPLACESVRRHKAQKTSPRGGNPQTAWLRSMRPEDGGRPVR